MRLRGWFAAAACVASLSAASAAGATVTIRSVEDGSLSTSGNVEGTIKAFKAYAGTPKSPNVYDFTFNILDSVDQTLTQLQAAVTSSSEPISFSIFKGSPTGSGGTLVGTSTYTVGSSATFDLSAGTYYLQLSDIAKAGELVSGSLDVSPIPEPAEWALLIAGFGMLGYAFRSRRQMQPIASLV